MSALVSDSPQHPMVLHGPDFANEKALLEQGYDYICGVDEAGRGPLAGPVVAAAVILNPIDLPKGLDDSKKLTETKRNEAFEAICGHAISFSIASVGAREIDRINVLAASLKAMTWAVRGLSISAGHALIDGNALPHDLPCSATCLIKGDERALSIAAASILAKVARDQMMKRAHSLWPEYGLAGHKGYPTKSHIDAVATYGPAPIHRKTFAPVAKAIAETKKSRIPLRHPASK